MKKLATPFIVSVLVGTLFLASCKKTDDPAPSGGTGGFFGDWYVTENSTVNGSATYNLAIESQNSTTLLFSYLYGFKTKISANYINNSFTIPMQIIEGSNVSGNGVLVNASQINMIYLVDNGLFIDSVTAVLTK